MDFYTSQVRREEASAVRSRLTSFVEQHEQQLFEAQQHFGHATDATHWSRQHDVVAVQLNDTATHVSVAAVMNSGGGEDDGFHQLRQRRQLQQTSMADLLSASALGSDPLLLRLSAALAALNAEMQALADEGKRCFAPALALVGDENENCYARHTAASTTSPSALSFPRGKDSSSSSGCPPSPEEEEALKEEQLLRQTGQLLSLFQDMWLWRQRVQEVCASLICQLACIYDDQAGGSNNSKDTKQRDASTLRVVRLSSCWDSLADVLGAVVVVDAILQQNSSLHEGMEVMQRVVAQQTMAASQDGHDDDDDELLRLLLHRLQEDLFHQPILTAVVRQPFDRLLRAAAVRGEQKAASSAAASSRAAPTPSLTNVPPPLREHKALCAEWAAVLTSRCNDFEAALASPRAAAEKSALAGICGLSRFFHAVFISPASNSNGGGGAGGPRPAPMPAAATAVAKMATAKLQALTKQVVVWQSALPLLPLHGHYALCPLLWWQRSFPAEVAAAVAVTGTAGVGPRIQESVVDACRAAGAQFAGRVAQWSAQVERWAAVEMHTAAPLDPPLCRQFVQRLVLLLQQGLQLARTIQDGVADLLFLHHHAERPLATSMVRGVLRGILLLQRIATAYHAKLGILASAQEALVQSIAYALERHLYSLYSRLFDDAAAASPAPGPSYDQLVALQAALHLLHAPLTTDTLACLAVVLDVALNREQLNAKAPPTTTTEQERDEVFIALVQLRSVASYQETVPAITQVSFLYFFREALYPLFFQECYENTLAAAALPEIVAALTESRALVMAARHVANPAEALLVDYAAFLRDCVEHEVVRPLCAEIENELRLRTHNVVLGQPYRVLQPSTDPAGRDLTRFTLLPPFRLFHVWVHVATQVAHYLSTQFYNLNALTPNDWRTYEEMRNLARRSYHLTIADSHLPGCILDQGLDVLVITENIHQFIAYYTYNLNEQVFIQRPSLTASKHLHTLNTRHIANSIRTHGTGVMNTAVNYVYKCLLKKMAVLSHFLQDDYVRSHLLKDARTVRQRKKEYQPVKYPVEQADQFAREMDRLGVAADGASFLEKARQLIGEMGNALGFMRMMRSGGLRAVAEGARFVPLPPPNTAAPAGRLSDYIAPRRGFIPPASNSSDDASASAEEKEEEEGDEDEDEEGKELDSGDSTGCGGKVNAQQSLRRSTAAAVENLDHITHSMLSQLSEGSEYFPLLLDAIGRRLRRSSPERYAHLHLLYLLVPALANLHVAYAIQEKEKLLKKHKDEGVFSDDGFAVGATFLLVLFGVYEDFDSLHWFANKKQQYRQSLESVHAALSSASASGSSDFNNLHLTSSTLHTNLKEYTSLENAFTSSKLFFATTTAAAATPSVRDGEKPPRSRRPRSPASSDAAEEREEDGENEDEDDDRDA